ncbi:hypothetical protein SAY86_014475 [Trapa natans]|uniref:NHL repeat-containing protein 2 n=1 Tax=Trapa natans TaxID=22666 RepID=A0AAN7QRE5_TRANT|nr:hypothetical protein SAY86_014475 [Trapa natans]
MEGHVDMEIKKLSGDGIAAYSDGQLTSAQFNQPRNFAVDLKGNIYVADKRNHAIRKINTSGVKTIAGGYSEKTGRGDGPGRNASFSSDFELSFIPQSCSLLISYHGNQLIHQILLKEEDCGKNDDSPSCDSLFFQLFTLCLVEFMVS